MTNLTWATVPTTGLNNYNFRDNWSPNSALPGPPTINDTAFFGASTVTLVSITSNADVGGWTFAAGASQYIIAISSGARFRFFGAGIIVDGGAANIDSTGSTEVDFFNNSSVRGAAITNEATMTFYDVRTAGNASIRNEGTLNFLDTSSAGNAVISNFSTMNFAAFSSAGAATIHTFAGATTSFEVSSDGGHAQFITDAGGKVDFSLSTGRANNFLLSVGSIAGAGTYDLGRDHLIVGTNGLSRTVSGPVDDGGSRGGSGASLIKLGHDTLKLRHAGNTYSGGTKLGGGTLDLAALGAAGKGAITFAAPSTLRIENAALFSHPFANDIKSFGKNDVLDLTGLKFLTGASAAYHEANQHLTIQSGRVIDTLTLLSPHGTRFTVAQDRHGGTIVTLAPPLPGPPVPAAMASASMHDIAGPHWGSDVASYASHVGDYLLVA